MLVYIKKLIYKLYEDCKVGEKASPTPCSFHSISNFLTFDFTLKIFWMFSRSNGYHEGFQVFFTNEIMLVF